MRFFAALLSICVIGAASSTPVSAYPLTLEQRQRLKQYLPRTFPKLEARDPVHVVAIGDSVMGGYTPLPSAWESNNPLFSYSGMFLDRLARDFFYPGGVRLLNPPPGGTNKRSEYLGDEITFENLTNIDGTILTGLRHSGTDAYLHQPDLILVQFGIYDALGRIPIDTYKLALQEIVDIGRRENVDMIIVAPTLVNLGAGEIEWGLTRPYAMAAEEVAKTNGTMFIDAGQYLSKFGGGVDPNTEPAAAVEIVEDRLARIFHYGPDLQVREKVHPAMKVNDYLGASMMDDLKDGPTLSDFTFAGIANFSDEGTVKLTMAIQNQTGETKKGSIGALASGDSLIPLDTAKRFSVPANAITQVDFTYRRPIIGKMEDGSDLLFPLEPSDEFGRFSFLLEDTFGSEIVDLPVRIGPITAVWKSRQFVNVTDRMRVEWDLVNGSDKPISGTFQVAMGDRIGEPTSFSVSPLGTKSVFSLFQFTPREAHAFQGSVWIQIEVGGVVTRFDRELEATRDLVLGEVMEMRGWSDYVNAPPTVVETARARSRGKVSARFDADDEALYVIASLEGIDVPLLGDRAALQAKLFLDARSLNEVRTFGAIKPIEIFTKGSDGPGFTPAIELGSFGNGYNMILDPAGITSVLETGERGERLLEVRVPRSYLHQHEWTLDSLESMLGIRLELTVADSDVNARDPFPAVNRFVTHSPTFAFEDKTIHGFHEEDARSLSTLRLSRQPVASWSVRIY
ncbi:MAG: SGNH/GDSL hydrolase family protein [Verrucomicrobiales bacterium]|nr:SGNH/GDSL hydrolase family protein [Verrucomicrobiales bacterium]